MSKLTNLKGRINYISSHARQENLYGVYETTERKFWSELAKCNQAEFVKSGTEGNCIEARELIIALPEHFVEYSPNRLLELFTNHFKQNYGTECISALHHNKRKTNYHIHLIFSERELLEEPIEKVATRNMFYDEAGKHVRTKKEILGEDGKIRPGCKVILKGEVYERNIFTIKDRRFKSDAFLEEVKKSYTELINVYVQNDKEKLNVFDRSSAYLPTKKIGKNNPKADQIKEDNLQRERWNQTVDRALVSGIPEQQIVEIKEMQIGRKVSQSIRQYGNNPNLFSSIILMAIKVLELLIIQILNQVLKPIQSIEETPKKAEVLLPADDMLVGAEVPEIELQEQLEQIPDRPQMSALASKFEKLGAIYEKLQKQGNAIHYKEQELEIVTIDHDECKGILKGKNRKELKEQMDKLETQIESMKRRFTGIVKEYGYLNAKAFMDQYKASKAEYTNYKQALDSWNRKYGKGQKPISITERIEQYKQEAKKRENNRIPVKRRARGAR
jgi:hypothetical protein